MIKKDEMLKHITINICIMYHLFMSIFYYLNLELIVILFVIIQFKMSSFVQNLSLILHFFQLKVPEKIIIKLLSK